MRMEKSSSMARSTRVHRAGASLHPRRCGGRAQARSSAARPDAAGGGSTDNLKCGFRSSAACCAKVVATSRRSTASAWNCARARRSASSAKAAPARHARPRHLRLISSDGAGRVMGRPDSGPQVQADAAVPARHRRSCFRTLTVRLSTAQVGVRHYRGRRCGCITRKCRREAARVRYGGAQGCRARYHDALSLSARILRWPAPAHRACPCFGAGPTLSCSTSRPSRSIC